MNVQIAGKSKPLGVTVGHPFFIKIRGARNSLSTGDDEGEQQAGVWMQADELVNGDQVKLANGRWAQVESISERAGGESVYNFEVANNHDYFVGQQGTLVHNAGACGRRGNPATRDHIDAVKDDFLQNNPTYRHTGGGRDAFGRNVPEEYLPPLGGGTGKGGSYPDLTFEAPDGSHVRINTVDTYRDGSMTPRELNNFNRIFEQTGEPVIAIPKP